MLLDMNVAFGFGAFLRDKFIPLHNMSTAAAQIPGESKCNIDPSESMGELSFPKYPSTTWDEMEVDSDAGQTNTGSVAATAAASVEAPAEVANAALVTDVAEAQAPSEMLDAPAEGAAGSAESDLVASAGNDQVGR